MVAPAQVTEPHGDPRRWFASLAPVAMLIALVAGVSILEPNFLRAASLRTLAEQFPLIFILALGQMTVILLGRIDLAGAAITSFAAILMATWIPHLGAVGIVAALVVTTSIGALHGWLHMRAQVASFMITLGGLGVWSGLALYVSEGRSLSVDPGVATQLFERTFGIPNAAIFAGLTAAAYAYVLANTTFGRRLFAVGNGQRAASLSGVHTDRVVIAGFAISGFFSGVAAVVLIAWLEIASPTTANSLLLPTIAAVILGGTAITGGVGGVGRTLVGAVMIAVLRVGLDVAGIESSIQPIIFGILAVMSVAVTIDRARLPVIK